MELDEYARIAAAEDDHWWYHNMRALMADVLRPWLRRDQLILDAGCGPGGNSAWLGEHGTVVGSDLSSQALGLVRARHPHTRAVRGDVHALPFPCDAFDVVVDVTMLYTVDNDGGAVRELARVLRPGGVALLVEPAFEALRRAHDRTVHSRRRYRRYGLAELVTQSGLRVQRATYACWYLAPPAALLGIVDRVRRPAPGGAGSDLERPALGAVFTRLANAERSWLRRHDVPFGTSAVVLATK
jgi:SAM-dependent methyltransferase